MLRNDSDHGHRLIVALRGTQSNRFGVGATVRIESASGPQVRQLVLARGYLSSSEPMLHFGLGEDTVVKQLTVTWPSGHTQSFTDLAVDKHYTITEPSTPFTPAAPPAPLPTQFSNRSEAANFSVASTDWSVRRTAASRCCRSGSTAGVRPWRWATSTATAGKMR